MAVKKLLENTLDESSKLKNISDKRLGCLTKSLLSQKFYRITSDLSKTLISHPDYGNSGKLGKSLLLKSAYYDRDVQFASTLGSL